VNTLSILEANPGFGEMQSDRSENRQADVNRKEKKGSLRRRAL